MEKEKTAQADSLRARLCRQTMRTPFCRKRRGVMKWNL